MNKLTIIVPVYNEQQTIAAVLQRLADLELPRQWKKEIIVVDDGSTDGSLSVIASEAKQSSYHGIALSSDQGRSPRNDADNYKILKHQENQGKGAAVKTGLTAAKGDYVIIQDADLEYDMGDIPRLLEEAGKTNAPAVFGSRNLRPGRRGYPHYVLGVKFLTVLVNLLYGAKLTDVYTCYKLIKTEIMRSLNLESRGFEFEAEVTTKLLRRGVKIREAPINYHPRTFAEGKKIGWRDGAKGLWTILKYWL